MSYPSKHKTEVRFNAVHAVKIAKTAHAYIRTFANFVPVLVEAELKTAANAGRQTMIYKTDAASNCLTTLRRQRGSFF